MIGIDVKADVKKVQVYLRSLSNQGTKRATSRALNKTGVTVRAEAARRIQQKRNLRIGEIKKQMRLERATVTKLLATVTVSGRPISMRHFVKASGKPHMQRAKAKILRGSKLTQLQANGNKAFVNAKWRPGVFVRKTRKRLPIRIWPPVPGLPTVLVQDQIVQALKQLASETFQKRFREEMNYEISKAKRA